MIHPSAKVPIGSVDGKSVTLGDEWVRYLTVDLLRPEPPLLVASLPTVQAGTRRQVTDATATTFASIVAGGGANNVPVYFDGTDWRIG